MLVQALYALVGPFNPIVPTGSAPGALVTAAAAVYPDGAPLGEALTEALTAVNVPLPALPEGAVALLRAHAAGPEATCLHPAWLRAHVRGLTMPLTATHAAALLAYAMSDVVDDDCESVMQVLECQTDIHDR